MRWAIDSESASPLTISGVVGARSFYPAAWHQITSVVVMATGADHAVAANTVALVIAAAVWPLAITRFVRAALGSHPVARVAMPLAAALSSDMLTFRTSCSSGGVRYPYALSLALVRASAALGTPIVAPASPVLSELIAEGGLILGDIEGPVDGSALRRG